MHLAPLIRDLAIILIVAGAVTILFHRIRQPVVLGYIVAGFIVGPYTPPFPLVKDLGNINTLAELGVIFLMFTLGLEFSFRKLLRVGAAAGMTALIEVSTMVFLGSVLARILGFSMVESLFIGGIVSISSTSIIVRALEELGLKGKRFAELTLGVLIVEDLLAILMMVAFASIAATGAVSAEALVRSAGRLVLVTGSWMLLGYFIVPRLVGYVGRLKSEETLSIVSLGLCLALVSIGALFGYSAALGAFIMGALLAESKESRRIENLMKPLKDLFAAIFFVSVGMLINPKAILDHKLWVGSLALLVVVGKITAASLGSLLSGQTLKTSILVGFGLAQIGEFSFIIAGVGRAAGAISEDVFAVTVAVSAITTFLTPYLMRHSPKVVVWLEKNLPHKLSHALTAYATWRERQLASRVAGPEFTARFVKWLVSAFVIILTHAAVTEYLFPWLKGLEKNQPLVITAAWGLTMVMCAPFIWAMVTSFNGYATEGTEKSKTIKGGLGFNLLMPILAFLLLGVLSLAYFPVKYVVAAGFLLLLLFVRKLYSGLERSFKWFEEGFMAAFKEGAITKSRSRVDVFKSFAPWDAHLARLKVHAESFVVGQKLKDAELRKKYGLNVVALQRGSQTHVAPKPDQVIFPKDELLVLASDEEIDKVRPLIESPVSASAGLEHALEGYELRPLAINDHELLSGKTIKEARIRELYGALVVGIERKNRRILNPESDLVLETGDILWLVGESTKIIELASLQIKPVES